MNSITEFDLGGIQFSPTWGAPDARKPPSKYGIFEPDEESQTGVRAKEYGLDAKPDALAFPYANAEE